MTGISVLWAFLCFIHKMDRRLYTKYHQGAWPLPRVFASPVTCLWISLCIYCSEYCQTWFWFLRWWYSPVGCSGIVRVLIEIDTHSFRIVQGSWQLISHRAVILPLTSSKIPLIGTTVLVVQVFSDDPRSITQDPLLIRDHHTFPRRWLTMNEEILQARTLEWVAISFSNAWKWKVKVKSLSHVQLLVTPWTAAYRLLHPWDFPGKGTEVGCHCLLWTWI